MTKAVELRTLADHELADRLEESRRELFNLRFQKATGQLDNTARIKHVKQDVARLLTVLRSQELEEETGEGATAGAEDETEREA